MTVETDRIFGLRLKRAADLVGEQGREAFWQTEIALDAKLISIVVTLYNQGNQSSSDVAATTGLSRQLVEHRLRRLEDDGYIVSRIDASDARKRTYALAPARRKEVKRAVETMADFEKVYDTLWREIGCDLSEALSKFEAALQEKSLLMRLCQKFPQYKELTKAAANDR